jgi:hypothetical protein
MNRIQIAIVATVGAVIISPAASAQTPRGDDGHPDLNGTWDNGSGIPWVRPQHLGASICIVGCEEAPAAPESAEPRSAPPPPDRPSYRPEIAPMVQDLNARQVEEDPVLRCENPGLPRIGPPDKIVQIPGQVVFLYDDVNGNYFRVIPTDGRGHRTDVEATYLGDAVGRWDGDTLVVTTVLLSEDTWLTDDGSIHSADLRVVERLTRTGDSLEWQATAYDSAYLSEPWEMRPRTAVLTDIEIVEAPRCIDRDLSLMQDGTSHDNPR